MSQSRSELESKAIFSAQQHIWHICEFMEKMMVLICQCLMTILLSASSLSEFLLYLNQPLFTFALIPLFSLILSGCEKRFAL